MENEETLQKIRHLRNELSLCKQMQNEYAQLYQSLQVLENEIEKLEKEIDNTFEEHRSKQKQSLLHECLQKKRKIDHRIDILEEYTVEQEEKLREHLLNSIISLAPLEATYIKTRIDIEKNLQNEYNIIEQIYLNLKEILEELKIISETRASIKKWSVFRYIFGQNPNLQIAKCLQNIKAIAQNLQRNLKKLDKEVPGLFKSLEKETDNLIQSTDKRWGFREIDILFVQKHENLVILDMGIKREKEKIKRMMDDNEREIEEWIDKHSSNYS